MLRELLFFKNRNNKSKLSSTDLADYEVNSEDEILEVSPENLARCSSVESRRLLTYEKASKFRCLPLGTVTTLEGEMLNVATDQLITYELINSIRFATGLKVKLIRVGKEVINTAIFNAYHGSGEKLGNSVQKLNKDENNKASIQSNGNINIRESTSDISKFLETLIDYAISNNASDLHIAPRVKGSIIRIRKNGELGTHESDILGGKRFAQLISRIKILSNLDTTVKNRPQDGSFKVPVGDAEVYIRVSIMPTIHGEKAVLRILNNDKNLSLESLNLDLRVTDLIRDFITQKSGTLILSGPTGSGKTTTLYSILKEMSGLNLNLISIEDPVEIQMPLISQTSIDESIGLDYPACLRSVLRQDPDVILIGEIRDEISAKIAFQAALTGHMILSTVHAGSVFDALLRLGKLGVDNLSLGRGLNLLLFQILLGQLCSSCKVYDLVSSKRLDFDVYREVGCNECDYSGFSNRIVATEGLVINSALSGFITEGRIRKEDLMNLTDDYSYISLESSLKVLLRDGKISYSQFIGAINER